MPQTISFYAADIGTASPSGQSEQEPDYVSEITKQANASGVPPALALSVAKRESNLDPDAVGKLDEVGLFQVRPQTAKTVDPSADLYNPEHNIRLGVTYLKQLLERYKGDQHKALMAYNGGPDNVDRGTVSQAAKGYADDVLKQANTGGEDRSNWDPRPDGTVKGDGFLGVLKLPNGKVASEFSIADSEKLKDAKGNYLDYPSLVPTLTKDEVQAVLKSAASDGKIKLPDSVYQKAESFALQRKKDGKPLFAQPGEQRTDLYSDIERAAVSGKAQEQPITFSSSEIDHPDSGMNFAIVNGRRVSVESDTPADLIAGVASTLNPIPAAQQIGKALIPRKAAEAAGATGPEAESYGPINAVNGLLKAQRAVGEKMVESYKQGDYLTAARHAIDWLLPVIGPAIDKAADDMAQGKPWRGAGEAIGLGLGMAGPEALVSARPKLGVPAVAKNPNAAEAAAVEFGQSRGVPVNAGVATGNRFVQGIQAAADVTPVGGLIERAARQHEAQALTRVGGELADTARVGAVTPEQAGATIADQLTQKIQAHHQYADKAYGDLRKIEANPKNAQTMTVGQRTIDMGVVDAQGKPVTRTVPITETMQLPVDLRSAKRALRPLYDRLSRQYSITQSEGSAGFKALGNIVNGADYAPLSQVEADLGTIKSIARADAPELRSKSQGIASAGVRQLDAAVQRAASKAGPDAMRALKTGRASTAAKYEAADVLDQFRDEPVQAYRQAIAPNDGGIDRLRTIQTHTPAAIPQIARAYLDEALGKATVEGGFDKAQRLQADWQKLGPETKKIMFPISGQIDALDKYFLLAKKMAESPNPSRSALTATSIGSGGLIFTDPATGIPLTLGAGALSKILRSPRAVKLLTKGLTITLGPGRAYQLARTNGVADILRAAREAGVSTSAVPAVGAEDQEPASSPR